MSPAPHPQRRHRPAQGSKHQHHPPQGTQDPDSRWEKIFAAILGIYIMIFFVCVVAIVYFAPPEMAEFKVFEVSYRDNNGTTVVLTWGKGVYILQGYHEFRLDHTYRLWYKTAFGGRPGYDCVVLEIEELGGPP